MVTVNNLWMENRPKIRVYSCPLAVTNCSTWPGGLRSFLEGRKRLVDNNPRQFIFEPNRFLRRKRSRIVERCNRNIDHLGTFGRFKKQMSAATCGKRTNPIRMCDLARFGLCHYQIVARYRSPGDKRRARASPAIDAMTIAQFKWPAL